MEIGCHMSWACNDVTRRNEEQVVRKVFSMNLDGRYRRRPNELTVDKNCVKDDIPRKELTKVVGDDFK